MTDALITLSVFDLLNAQTFFEWFVENANYWFVFLFMMVESSFIPFPSEVVVPPAAYLAVQSYFHPGQTLQVAGTDMNVFVVVLVATAGALCGALVNYYLSLWIGRPIVYGFADSRLGHACLIDRAKVEKAEKYFDKNGAVSTFIGRLIPAVRQLISIPAGLAKMNIGVFIVFTAMGALLWNAVLATLGVCLAKYVPLSSLFATVEHYNHYLTYAGLAIALFCVAYIAYKALKNKK